VGDVRQDMITVVSIKETNVGAIRSYLHVNLLYSFFKIAVSVWVYLFSLLFVSQFF